MKYFNFILLLSISFTSFAAGTVIDNSNDFNFDGETKITYNNTSGGVRKTAVRKMFLDSEDAALPPVSTYSLMRHSQSGFAGWDLNETPFMKLNFTEIQKPYNVLSSITDSNSKLSEKQAFISSENLSPVINLRSLIEEPVQNVDFSSINILSMQFNSLDSVSTPIAFKLNSVELLDFTSEPIMQSRAAIDALDVNSRHQGSNEGATISRQLRAGTNGLDVNSHDQSSNEDPTHGIVPEPFSILTIGTGFTAFIKKRKQSRKN